ncbi:anhydro-N-acetylmuramic acid kinase [Caenispirillum salinarum]|nr:anhydro-N-acetylmuramic acid kinase [Caenispirillum salinarum]
MPSDFAPAASTFQPLRTIGLMSGTSMDGIDAAMIVTDGHRVLETGPRLTRAYDKAFRDRLRACLGGAAPADEIAAVERELTLLHAEVVDGLMAETGAVDVIGFHGHTILHRPEARRTWQIGDGALLARETGVPVIDSLRTDDVAAGGQGAPLVPVYHAALAEALDKPLAVLNVGGVANVTFIGRDGTLIAFDTGPGNALIDDWVYARAGVPMDAEGRLALKGRADEGVVAEMLAAHPYFEARPPKSLDRDDFTTEPVAALGTEDGAATLTAFTAAAVAKARDHLPEAPALWIVTGGGRLNPALVAALSRRLAPAAVEPVELVGWDGDAVEAQAFAFLAVRSLRGLPLTMPGTTGCPEPLSGGRRHNP